MRIIRLEASNFKRLSAVEIQPDGALVVISGRNGAGKSSVLDSIWAALGGKAAEPEQPIRKGKQQASASLDLGELQITRTWDAGSDRSSLTVRQRSELAGGEDGYTRISSPQTVLDKLVGSLSFDPLAFTRMRGADQARVLRELTGLDFSEINRRREKLYADRTEVNRQGKELAARVKADPTFSDDLPEEEISVTALLARRKAANTQLAQNEEVREALEDHEREVKEAAEAVAELERQLAEAHVALKQLNERTPELTAKVSALNDPDVGAIEAQIGNAEEVNRQIRSRAQCRKRAESLDALRKDSRDLTADLDAIEAEKAKRLAETPMPVEGLSFDGEAVYLDGVPFTQASSAQQLQCGLAIGAALNPKLRVVLVRDGSLLDAESLRCVAEWASANDMQVWLERVAGDQPVGIVIEDGMVAGNAPATEAVGAAG